MDKAKAFHLKARQKEVAQQQQKEVSSNYGGARRSGTNEQWVMNVEESERSRWLDTIRCDQKRIRQCVSQMKQHQFSDNYLPPIVKESGGQNDGKKGGNKK